MCGWVGGVLVADELVKDLAGELAARADGCVGGVVLGGWVGCW